MINKHDILILNAFTVDDLPKFSTQLAGLLNLNVRTVQRRIKALNQQGCLKIMGQAQNGIVLQPYYRLTAKGKKYLDAITTETVAMDAGIMPIATQSVVMEENNVLQDRHKCRYGTITTQSVAMDGTPDFTGVAMQYNTVLKMVQNKKEEVQSTVHNKIKNNVLSTVQCTAQRQSGSLSGSLQASPWDQIKEKILGFGNVERSETICLGGALQAPQDSTSSIFIYSASSTGGAAGVPKDSTAVPASRSSYAKIPLNSTAAHAEVPLTPEEIEAECARQFAALRKADADKVPQSKSPINDFKKERASVPVWENGRYYTETSERFDNEYIK